MNDALLLLGGFVYGAGMILSLALGYFLMAGLSFDVTKRSIVAMVVAAVLWPIVAAGLYLYATARFVREAKEKWI